MEKNQIRTTQVTSTKDLFQKKRDKKLNENYISPEENIVEIKMTIRDKNKIAAIDALGERKVTRNIKNEKGNSTKNENLNIKRKESLSGI